MATLEVGKVCMKTAGREAGKYCVVLKKMDNNFVLITGPKVLTGVKRRRCNVEHLEPTPFSVKIDAEASDNVVIKAYDSAGITTKLGLRRPSPEVVKEVPKKVEKPKEVKKPVKEEKPAKKEEKKVEKKEEKPKKKGITLKLKIPSLRKKKPKEEKKVEKKKPEKKPKKKAAKKPVKKKPSKKPKKAVKKGKKKK